MGSVNGFQATYMSCASLVWHVPCVEYVSSACCAISALFEPLCHLAASRFAEPSGSTIQSLLMVRSEIRRKSAPVEGTVVEIYHYKPPGFSTIQTVVVWDFWTINSTLIIWNIFEVSSCLKHPPFWCYLPLYIGIYHGEMTWKYGGAYAPWN